MCFFFQAEDGIRDYKVTGVQTCALPILVGKHVKPNLKFELFTVEHTQLRADGSVDPSFSHFGLAWYQSDLEADEKGIVGRSEERRVGKEGKNKRGKDQERQKERERENHA